ncbi:MAG: hypothetical protein ACRC5S_08950, partial [Cetobacterium sp.]
TPAPTPYLFSAKAIVDKVMAKIPKIIFFIMLLQIYRFVTEQLYHRIISFITEYNIEICY